MDKDVLKNLRQRHIELKKLGKVTSAVELSGVSKMTYGRAIKGGKHVRAETIITILRAQAKVLEATVTKLQLA